MLKHLDKVFYLIYNAIKKHHKKGEQSMKPVTPTREQVKEPGDQFRPASGRIQLTGRDKEMAIAQLRSNPDLMKRLKEGVIKK